MGDLIKWIVIISIKVSFWAAVIFTFLPIVTIVSAAVLTTLSGTILFDLYYMVQMWLPFNLNVILLWSLSLATAFALWWVANWIYGHLNKLVGQEF